MSEVFPDAAEFSSSNAMIEWLAAADRSRASAHGGHAFAGGTMAYRNDRGSTSNVAVSSEFAAPGLLQSRRSIGATTAHATRYRPAFVMLHLRSCYVSKAAILTIPVRSVPVENRSPT